MSNKLHYNNLGFFINSLSPESDEIDLSKYIFIDPVYYAIIESLRLINENKEIKVFVKDGDSYDYAKAITGNRGSSSTVPIRMLTESNRKEAEKVSREIISLMDIQDGDVRIYMGYVLTELINNAVDHSLSKTPVVVYGQLFPKINEIEIGIIDTGVGFKETISRRHSVKNELEAIKKSVEKGISGSTATVYGDVYKNAGYGLFVVSNMIKDFGGFLRILSKDTLYKYPEDKHKVLNNQWKGSIILSRFNLDKIQDKIMTELWNYIAELSNDDGEGEDLF